MRVFFRCSILALSSVVLLGVVGCGQDNEGAIREQAAQSAPVTPPKPQPKTQAEYGQMQRAANPYTKSSGYPGARR